MKKFSLGNLCLIILILSSPPISAATEPTQPYYNWNGFYLGATTGAAFSNFNTKTSIQANSLLTTAQANAINNSGDQKIQTSGFFSGIEGGYNWQFKQLLLGIETDIQALSNSSNTYSGAIPDLDNANNHFVVTSYASNNWLFTLRPRLGFIANNWLFYATGGLGLAYIESDFIFSDLSGQLESQRVNDVTPGYVVGGGVETGLTQRISLKAEYLFESFRSVDASSMNYNLPPNQTISNSVNMKSNVLKIGVQYHFNQQGNHNNPFYISDIFSPDQWETEMGLRVFSSSGLDGTPQPLLNSSPIGNVLASRLTFSNLTGISGETFARADHTNGFFTKGYLGAGSITNGHLNDEDFPALGAYSNTLSNASGNLSYATWDFGYSFFKKTYGKTGVFLGYNYYAENINVYDCQQLAGAGVCRDSEHFSDFLGISEDDKFNSLRLGLTSQMSLTDRLTLTSEAAYLPLVNFRGQDIHDARQLIGPEFSSHGDGAMLESLLDYQFSHSWSVGLGGRYWMWNSHDGNIIFEFIGSNDSPREPARFTSDRYGVFLQLSYHNKPDINLDLPSKRIDWSGAHIGMNLGGGWGTNNWSDPFGNTPGDPGYTNVSGFGDQIHETGPLGGAELNYLWQKDKWVYGLGVNANASDIRGDGTLFSGLGGINGQAIDNYLGTILGKLGVACNRSLFYLDGGPAILNTTYKLNANTNALELGSENQSITRWGWSGGAGIEYAFTDRWSSKVEYDYVYVPGDISFPTIETINSNRYSVNQRLNIFKLGIDYKI